MVYRCIRIAQSPFRLRLGPPEIEDKKEQDVVIFLFDQDGVLADFDKSFFEMAETNPKLRGRLSFERRTRFSIKEDYPVELHGEVAAIYQSPGFFLNLKPFPHAIEIVRELVSLSHTVAICTTPLTKYTHCVLEKYQWVERNLGEEYTRRLILTKDKTLVQGTYLIDDKPDIKGAFEDCPSWEHLIFDAPYNQLVINKRRIKSDWSNFKEVVGL